MRYYDYIETLVFPLSASDFEREMQKCFTKQFGSSDMEGQHSDADDLLCAQLKALGFEGAISCFEKQHKWYG